MAALLVLLLFFSFRSGPLSHFTFSSSFSSSSSHSSVESDLTLYVVMYNKGMATPLKFTGDVTLIARDKKKKQKVLEELNKKSKEIDLKINISKTKYLTNDIEQNQDLIVLENIQIEKVDSHIHLGKNLNCQKTT